jgi:hypothetical protein
MQVVYCNLHKFISINVYYDFNNVCLVLGLLFINVYFCLYFPTMVYAVQYYIIDKNRPKMSIPCSQLG